MYGQTQLNAKPSQNLWVATGYAGGTLNNILYSANGINWTSANGFAVQGYGVAWNGSFWVAVGDNAGSSGILYSPSGINWLPTTGGFTGIGYGVAWNGAIWVAVGQGGSAASNILYSTNGTSWNTTTGGFSVGGYGVAWNGSIWVAVGSGESAQSNILYSSNGISWNTTTGGFNIYASGVAWNGYMWVAVGAGSASAYSSSNIIYSYNGINWNQATGGFSSGNSGSGQTLGGYGVSWNGSMWIATGQGSNWGERTNNILYSYDGINWANTTTGAFVSFGSVGVNGSSYGGQAAAWNGSMWVAVGDSGEGKGGTVLTPMAYSYDGMTWYDNASLNGGVFLGSFQIGTGVAYSQTLTPDISSKNLNFYLQNQPTYLTSTHQILATQSTLVINNTTYIDKTNNRVGINNPRPAYTLDVTGTINATSNIYINGAVVLTSSGGGATVGNLVSTVQGLGSARYVSSLSLVSTVRGLGSSGYVSSLSLVSTVQGLGSSGYVSSLSLVSTVRGLGQWYLSTIATSQLPSSINVSSISTFGLTVYGQTQLNATPAQKFWVAVGSGAFPSGTILGSSNGTDWSSFNGGSGALFANAGYGVAWNGSIWVAVGDNGGVGSIIYSIDGKIWDTTTGDFTIRGSGVAWNGSMWVAVGSGGSAANNILYSTNGTTWNPTTGGFATQGYGVAWNGSIWVAVGQGGSAEANILYSTDGINWNPTTGGFSTTGNGIAWNGSIWVAVGSGGSAANNILYSYNGINWNSTTGGFAAQGYGVAWNGSVWVAVGNGGSAANNILYSTDGINWNPTTTGGFASGIGKAIAWNGSIWVATGNAGASVENIITSTDGQTWSQTIGGFLFPNSGYGIAYSQTLTPDISSKNLNFYLQNQPTYLTSTHQILATQSTLVINNTTYIDKTNNRVGINNPRPAYTLDVTGTINATSNIYINGAVVLTSSGGGATVGNLVSTVRGLGSSGYISSLSLVSTVLGLRTNFSSLSGVFSSIGIGCNLPAYALDVNGYVNIKGAPSYGNIRIQGTSVETAIMMMDPTNVAGAVSGWLVGQSASFTGVSPSTINIGRVNNYSVISPAALSINSNGNVGIQTTPTNFPLTVAGSINLLSNYSLCMTTGGNSGNGTGIYDQSNARFKINFPNSNNIYYYGDSHNFFTAVNGSTQHGFINSTEIYSYNNIRAANDVIANSDKRYKENITTISNATNIVENLRGVYYTRKDDDKEIKTRKVGLIAQETEEALPEVVHTDSTEDAYKSISYGNIVAVLIEGMKEQQSTIRSQNIQIQTLQTSFNTLLSQVSTLVG